MKKNIEKILKGRTTTLQTKDQKKVKGGNIIVTDTLGL